MFFILRCTSSSIVVEGHMCSRAHAPISAWWRAEVESCLSLLFSRRGVSLFAGNKKMGIMKLHLLKSFHSWEWFHSHA
ncbi:unnamed protein product [Musa banksii]